MSPPACGDDGMVMMMVMMVVKRLAIDLPPRLALGDDALGPDLHMHCCMVHGTGVRTKLLWQDIAALMY